MIELKNAFSGTSYESPINIFEKTIYDDIAEKVSKDFDNAVYKAVMDVGIMVDKEELIKALKYDREQYEKGYKNGWDAAMEKIREERNKIMFSIENDIVYSIEYIDRSNWLAKKIPVMDKETFIKCFKEWITPGEKAVEPKMGHWITKDGKEQGYDIGGVKIWYIQIMCSECGFIKTAIEGHTGQYHYCPNCGTKMENADE